MLPFNTTVWFYRHPVDFRRQIDGLMLLVADTLEQDPTSGQLFVFRNRQADKLKMLIWDTDGFWLLYKRLEKGTFKFPGITEEALKLSVQELQWLISGLDIAKQPKRKPLKYSQFF